MTTYDQRGQKVNNQVNINIENTEKNLFQQGINAIKSKSYSFAVSCFEKSFQYACEMPQWAPQNDAYALM